MLSFLCKHTCVFCDASTNRKLDLCCACEHDLPFLQNSCVRCARPLPVGKKICGSCLNSSPCNINTTALFQYQSPIDQLILNLKFRDNLVSAKVLGELLGDHLSNQYLDEIRPEIIIPMPLHPMRLRERGYNQALELARPIARKLNIPIDKFSVQRIKNTTAQAKLSAKEREQNVKRAFEVTGSFKAKHVAVIDDVITTGNTVAELCNALHRSGVNKIDVWCCAKAN